MAPQGLQKQKGAASYPSQEGALLAAVKKFDSEIVKARKIAGRHIDASKSLNPLRESIRAYRKTNQEIPEDVIEDLITSIDNKGNNLCHRLEPAIFSVLIEAMLQAQPCRQAERGLYLLADSLFEDNGRLQNERTLAKRKDQIGKDSLQPLLNYFVDAENDTTMRRRVGILCGQICNECQPNLARLELGSDVLRQKIGPALIDESDELVRVICGHLIRDLNTSGCKLACLFPPDADKRLYESFPSSTQGNGGWTAQFDHYIDYATSLNEQPAPPDPVFYGTNLRLEPTLSFGMPDKTVYMHVSGDELTILAPASPKNMDQILEIPLPIVGQMTVILGVDSQNEIVEVIIQLVRNDDYPCYLDATPVVLKILHITAQVENAREFGSRLKELCPPLILIEQQKDDLENADRSEIWLSQQKDEIMIERDHASIQLPEDSNANEGRQPSPFGSQQQDSIMVDRENLGSHLVEEEDTEGSDQPMAFASQQRHSITVNRENAESYQELEGRDNPILSSAQNREPCEEDSNAVQMSRISNLHRGDVPSQTSEDEIYNVSPSIQRGRRDTKIASRPVTKQAMKLVIVDSEEPASKIKQPARKQVIKPKAKPPLILSAPSFQTQVVSNKSNPPTKVKGVDQTCSRTPLPSAIRGSTAVSPSSLNAKHLQEETRKTPTQRDETPVLDENDNITSPNKSSIIKKLRSEKLLLNTTKKPLAAFKAKRQIAANDVAVISSSSKNGKRYGLKPIVKERKPIQEADPFTIPADEDEDENDNFEESKVRKKTAAKPKSKARKSTGAIKKKVVSAKGEAKKKRQSAPAKILSITITRNRKKGAAPEAIIKIQDPDVQPDDIEAEAPTAQTPGVIPISNRDRQKGNAKQAAVTTRNSVAAADVEKCSEEMHAPNIATKNRQTTKTNPKMQSPSAHEQRKQAKSLKKLDAAKESESQTISEKSQVQKLIFGSSPNDEPEELPQTKTLKIASFSKKGAKRKGPPKSEERVFDSEMSEILEETEEDVARGSKQIAVLSDETVAGMPATKDAEPPNNHLEAEPTEAKAIDKGNASIAATKTLPLYADTIKSKPGEKKEQPAKKYEPKVTDPLQLDSNVEDNEFDKQQLDSTALELLAENLVHLPQSSDIEEDQVNRTRAVPATNGNAITERKVTKTCSRAKESMINWAESLGRMFNSDSEENVTIEATKGEQLRNATDDGSILAKDPHCGVQPTTQIPNTERGTLAQDLNFDTDKKRKSVADEHQLSNKRRAIESTQTPATSNTNPPLLSTVRKPQVISFASNGPKNQGLHTQKFPDQYVLAVENEGGILYEPLDLKRKRNVFASSNGHNFNGPLKKRQGTSPTEGLLEFPANEARQVQASGSSLPFSEPKDEHMGLEAKNSPPPAPMAVSRLSIRAKRLSSQSSRVDYNGSPIASPSIEPVDRLGKLKERLSGEVQADKMTDSEGSCAEELIKSRASYLSTMFEPRIILGSQAKARPSSPSKSGDRYVAHEKTKKGHYQGIQTKEIVEEHTELADPFSAEKSNHNNRFVQRLKDGDGRTNPCSTQHAKQVRRVGVLQDPKAPRATHCAKVSFIGGEKDSTSTENIIRQTTRNEFKSRNLRDVASKQQARGQQYCELSTPSEMTSGSSVASSQAPRTPLGDWTNDKHWWNVSIRPYYTQAADALHRAVDETIVQLSSKEDRMGHLVNDYEAQGGKVLCNFEVEHNKQLSNVQKVLQRKNVNVLDSYKDANEFVGKNAQESQEDSVAGFEKEWRKRQAWTQEKILKGMKKSR